MAVVGIRRRRGILAIAIAPVVSASISFAASPAFDAGITTGNLQNSALNETSGIAASRMNPNVLWVHEDSGAAAVVHAITPAGVQLGSYTVTGAAATDWEDIAVGPGPTAGAQYLYIGDIGDNASGRTLGVSVYRVPEPTVSDTQSPLTTSIAGMARLNFLYPNGPHDAESLFVDPLTRDIYIVSKREATKYVYRAPYPQSTSGTTTMELVASLANSNWITAADISSDGDEIIMRSGATDTGLMYIRPGGGTVADAFATTPISIPLLSEAQGEAIGFDPQGWGYYTTSEGVGAPIHYFNRLPPPAAAMYWDNDGVAAGSHTSTAAGLGGSGTWNASALNWYNASSDVTWENGNDAIFTGTAGTVTLAAATAVNSLAFKSSGYVITGSTLTLTGPNVTVDADVTATISSIVAGSTGLTKNGPGTLVLTSSSNQTSGYTGGTIINAGTLNISTGAISHSGVGVTINNGATLQFTGNFTLAAARPVTLGPGGGVVDVQSNTTTIAGVISGSSLTKTGTGTLALTNTNTYTGGTTVSAGSLVLTKSFTTGSTVDISNAATLKLSSGSASVLRTSSLSFAGAGKIDLTNNKLIVTGQSLTTVQSNINTHIVTTDPLALSQIASLAAATAGSVSKTTFGGVSVASSDVLVMYTWTGDADLTGNIDGDDYALIDAGYSGSLSGYANGDFNYSGTVDADDYWLIDRTYSKHLAPLSASMPAGATSVPEPSAAALLALATVAWASRPSSRQRRRRFNR